MYVLTVSSVQSRVLAPVIPDREELLVLQVILIGPQALRVVISAQVATSLQ